MYACKLLHHKLLHHKCVTSLYSMQLTNITHVCKLSVKLIVCQTIGMLIVDTEEEKCEENGVVFRNAYLVNYLPDLLQIWYVKSCIWGG